MNPQVPHHVLRVGAVFIAGGSVEGGLDVLARKAKESKTLS